MLAIDLYCGLGGWTSALLAEGWTVIGFDLERHDYGNGGYPAQLVLQDVIAKIPYPLAEHIAPGFQTKLRRHR